MKTEQPTLLASREEILVAAAATIKRGNIALKWMNGSLSTEQARLQSKCSRQALHQRAGRLMHRADQITKNLQRFAKQRIKTNEQ
tara:strand:- start:704 stop:958 length:255 start_codon:yes stop_codon:yes gene_type:complete